MTEPTDKLPGLHALRVAAALAVFLGHAVYWVAHWAQPITTVLAKLTLGLQLFYVVSAFALMHSTRVYESAPDWVTQFYLKRFWRIAPLFYVMMIVDALYTYHNRGVGTTFPEVALNVLFLNNLVPRYTSSLVFAGWSVSVEMLFYCVFPLVFVYIRSLKAGIALAAVAIVVSACSRIYLEQIPDWNGSSYADWCVLAQLQYFALGALAYLVYERLKLRKVDTPASQSTALLHHALFAMPILAIATLILLFRIELRDFLRLDLTLSGVLFALLTVWLTVLRIPALSWAPIQFYGERSYSLYLLHVLVIYLMRHVTTHVYWLFQPFMGSWALAPALIVTYLPILAVAPLTYALVEKPGMEIGRRLRSRLKRRPTPHLLISSP